MAGPRTGNNASANDWVSRLIAVRMASISGRWDNDARTWVRDDSARSEIRKGIRIARQQIAPELIVIPVSAATGGN